MADNTKLNIAYTVEPDHQPTEVEWMQQLGIGKLAAKSNSTDIAYSMNAQYWEYDDTAHRYRREIDKAYEKVTR